MNRKEMKERAKKTLGGGIFTTPWLYALLVLLIESAIIGVAGLIPSGIVSLLIAGPLSIGVLFYFMKLARGEKAEIPDMFNGFTSDFGGNFLVAFMVGLFTFLWSLLFVIPGIVKSYSYAMAFYLKNDHPEMDWKVAIDTSKKMMKGHKMELFVLDLSFIGWYIVGSLCFGVGVLWVAPYHMATRTEFYENLKNQPVVE